MPWPVQFHRPSFLKHDESGLDHESVSRFRRLTANNERARTPFFMGLVTIGRNYPDQLKIGRPQPPLPSESPLPLPVAALKALTQKLLARKGWRLGEWQLPIRKLQFADTDFQQKDMVTLGRAIESGHLSQLQDLDLSDNPHLNRFCMARLVRALESGGLTSLQSFNLRDTDSSDGCVDQLFAAISTGCLPALVRLEIGGQVASFHAESGEHFANAVRSGNLSRLQVLNFSHNGLKSHDALAIMGALVDQRLPLAWLDLSGNDLTKRGHQGREIDGIKALCGAIEKGNLQHLRLLDMSGSWLSASLSFLYKALESEKLPALRVLCLGSQKHGPIDPNWVPHMTLVQDWALKLQRDIRDAYNRPNAAGIEVLKMTGVALSLPEQQEFLGLLSSGRLSALRILDFSDIKRAPFCMNHFVQALNNGRVHQLRTLSLSRNNIASFQLPTLLAAAPVCFRNLRVLELDYNSLDRESIVHFCNAIKANYFPQLEMLSVANSGTPLKWERLYKSGYKGQMILSFGESD